MTKAYGSKHLNAIRIILFGNEGNEGFVDVLRYLTILKTVLINKGTNVLAYNVPIFMKKYRLKPIGTRSFIGRDTSHNNPDFHVGNRVKKNIIILLG